MQPFAEQFVAHLDTLSPIEIEQTIEAVRAGHEQTRKEARNINTKRFKESASLVGNSNGLAGFRRLEALCCASMH